MHKGPSDSLSESLDTWAVCETAWQDRSQSLTYGLMMMHCQCHDRCVFFSKSVLIHAEATVHLETSSQQEE